MYYESPIPKKYVRYTDKANHRNDNRKKPMLAYATHYQ